MSMPEREPAPAPETPRLLIITARICRQQARSVSRGCPTKTAITGQKTASKRCPMRLIVFRPRPDAAYLFSGPAFAGMVYMGWLGSAGKMSATNGKTRGPAISTTRHETAVEMAGVYKSYGDFLALKDINLTVKRRERVVICGPSGSGKSTLIRCINRLEEHQRGRIVVDGVEVTADQKNVDAIRRE